MSRSKRSKPSPGAKPVKRRAAQADPVLTEIVRNGVLAVTEEMKTNLMRTAYNMIIYEALDFTVGLYTADGETVSIGLGLPTFIRGMAETVKAKLTHFGKAGLEPGDILVTNDAYTTGSHLYHFTFSKPIFHEGKLCAFACCMAHWPDVGGVLGGVTTDIYSEGLQIPIAKYQRAGVVNRDLVDIIRMNVRLPERAMGDLRAQITAVNTGERRFLELLDRYGRERVLAGDTHNSPCEQMEAKFPLLFEKHALRQDSGGAGRFRGGLGTEQVIQARAPLMMNVQADRMHCKPWGLAGGLPGMGNEVTLRIAGKDVDDLPNAKVLTRHLKPGDSYTLRAGGGGGFGPPEERPPERVAEDVRQGYVSRMAARELYAVEVDERGGVDRNATAHLRAGRRNARAA